MPRTSRNGPATCKKPLDSVISYVKAVVGDTRYHAACTIHDETGLLADAASDIVGALCKVAMSRVIRGVCGRTAHMAPTRAKGFALDIPWPRGVANAQSSGQ